MLKLIEIVPVKTYKSRENAVKAVDKVMSKDINLRYFIHTHTDGRFFPVFIGMEAIQLGVHFKFNVIG